MTEFAVIVALGTLAAGLAATVALRLLPTVRLQLTGLALVAVALPLGAVILGLPLAGQLSGLAAFDIVDSAWRCGAPEYNRN